MGRHLKPDQAFIDKVKVYAKFIVAVAGAVGATATQIGIDGVPQTWQQWVPIGLYFLTALGVRQVPNEEKKDDVL